MYYKLYNLLVDGDKHPILEGSIYNQKQKILEDNIFLIGEHLDKKEVGSNFTIILDRTSKTKGRKELDKTYCTMSNCGALFLVSKQSADFFNNLKIDNLQFFDVEIKGANYEKSDQKIVNITSILPEAINRELSKIDYFDDGDIQRINSLVLYEDKIPPNVSIFLVDPLESIIIVHEKLKEAIERENLSGFLFESLLPPPKRNLFARPKKI